MADPRLLESTDGVADVLGMPFVVPSAADSTVSKRIMATGRTEPQFTEMLRRIIAPGSTVMDVGANIGYFTCVMAQGVGTSGRVIAFEPFARPRRYLQHNIELNGFRSVCVDPRALADWTGPGYVTLPAYRLERDPADAVGDEVDVVPLDSAAADWDLSALDIVKVDIEGAELRALEGMRSSIARWAPALAIEVHPGFLPLYGDSVDALEAFFEDVGYSWTRVEPPTHREPNYRIIAAPRDRLARWRLAASGARTVAFALDGSVDWASPATSRLSVPEDAPFLRVESRVPPEGHEYLLTSSYSTETPPERSADASLSGDAYAELEWDAQIVGGVDCMVWLLEYDATTQVARRSLPLTPGAQTVRILTHPQTRAYRLGLRFSGEGTVLLRRLELAYWEARG